MKINHTELRSFFIGTLLGDSYIHNGGFYCKQISKDLIMFKKKIIEENLPDAKISIKEYESYTDKNGVHHQKYYLLSVSGSEYIKKFEKLFYPNGKKILPKVLDKLTPIGYAMWYADDGATILVQYNQNTGSAKSRRVQICTDSFTTEEHDYLIEHFASLGYSPVIVKRSKLFRLQLNAKSAQKFILNIGNYFYQYFPSLLYKMDLGYRNKSLDNRTYVCEEYKNFYIKMSAHPIFYDRIKDRMI
jgi:hypothetical protein